ncbi:MAG: hypothetical protein SOS24_04140 [Clostridia bacterium]|nr:hypothetical protein [Clostridia bacterium]
MIKKLTALLLAFSIGMSFMTIGFAEETQPSPVKNDDGAADLLFELNIASKPENGTVYDSQPVTRAQYTDMLVRVLLKGETITQEYKTTYDDVYPGHEYGGSISFAYYNSIIDNSEKFYPDEQADAEFAMKATASALGYRYIKDYPGEWSTYIDKKDLIKSIDISDGYFSLNDAYIMIYNALKMPCLEVEYTNGFVENLVKTDTLGKKCFELEFAEGRCTATERGTIYGSKAGAKKIAIDGKEYFCDMDKRYSLLGYYTEAVINGDGTVISLRPIERYNKTTVISPEDYCDYDGDKITYYKSGSIKTVTLDNAVILYNGSNVTGGQFTKNIFNVADGAITVIASRNGKNDVISIENWSSFIVGSKIESSAGYDVYASNIAKKYITLDFDGCATLKSADGKSCDISEVKKGMLITYKSTLDGKYADAVISQNTVMGKPESLDEDKVTIGGVTYRFNKEILNGRVSFNDFSRTYLWYITPFGSIGAVDYNDASGINKGYIVSAYLDDGGENGFIKVVDNVNYNKSRSVTFALKDKIKLDGETNTAKKAVDLLNSNQYNNVSGKASLPIFYLVNAEDEITQIDTPYLGLNEDPKTSLREITITGRYDSKGRLYAKTDNAYRNEIEHTYILPMYGTLIYCASDLSDAYTAERLQGDRYYNSDVVKLYTEGNDTFILDFLVYINNDGEQASTDYEKQLWVVDKVLTTVDEQNEITKCIQCTSNGREYEYLVNTSLYEKNNIPGMDTLAKGDVVQFSFDTKGQVNGMSRLIGMEDRNAPTGWRLTPTNDHVLKFDYNREFRCVFGKIYDIKYSADMGKYIVTYYVDGPTDFETVYYSGKEFTMYDSYDMQSVDASAIKTYKDYGEAADNILIRTTYCIVSQMFVFKNQQ